MEDAIEIDFDPSINDVLIRLQYLIRMKDLLVDSKLFSVEMRDMLIDNLQREIDRIVSDVENAGAYLNG